MIELSKDTSRTAAADEAGSRPALPCYQRTQIAVRLWGERALEQVAAANASMAAAVGTVQDAAIE